MNNDFKTLIDFLDRFEPEVSGRSLSLPNQDMLNTLIRFAKGGCDDVECVEICKMLHQHPVWIRWVADRIKMARPDKT